MLANKPTLGKHLSDEAKKKISEAMSRNLKGNKRRLGIPHTEETKKRISQTSLARWRDDSFRKSARRWWNNLTNEERREVTQKSVQAMKRFWESLTPDERLAINANGRLAASKSRPTSIETTIEALLKSSNIAFESQKPIGKYIVDIYVPTKKLIIEVDGDYWHSLSGAIKRDKKKDIYLQGLGYQVIRIPEHIIKKDLVGIQPTIFDEIAEA